MYLEVAIVPVLQGREADFEKAFETACTEVYPMIEGWKGAQLRRGVERPNEFMLLIEWATVEDHTERFPQTPQFQTFKGLIGDLVAGPPEMAHWRAVASGSQR